MRRFYYETEERIRVIISIVIEAFEKDEYWLVVQKIEEAKRRDVETFVEALESFGLVDMAMMAQQARRRIALLDELDALIQDTNTLEKTIHVALEKNLWVFGTEYSLMSSNITLARVINEYTNKHFSGSRAHKRPDLFLAHNVYRRHLLIEFKRPSHTITRDDENQAEKYRDDLTPNFGAMNIMVIGKDVDPKISTHYESKDIQLLAYSNIISQARLQLQWLIDELTQE